MKVLCVFLSGFLTAGLGRVHKQAFIRGFSLAMPADLGAMIEIVAHFLSIGRASAQENANQTTELLERR